MLTWAPILFQTNKTITLMRLKPKNHCKFIDYFIFHVGQVLNVYGIHFDRFEKLNKSYYV